MTGRLIATAALLASFWGTAAADVATWLSVGGRSACAVNAAGGAMCWGTGGLLGDGTEHFRSTPVAVSGLSSGVAAVDVGETVHACALTTGGAVHCWGRNDFGELGNGTTSSTTALTPVAVVGAGSAGIAQVSAGGNHTCALTTAGGVVCWGGNSSGQLGDGTPSGSATPVAVSGLASGVAAVSAGLSHTCALTTGGGVKCWGANFDGQLGDGTTTASSVPIDVPGLASGVAQVSAGTGPITIGGTGATCALLAAGGVKCWGRTGPHPFGTTPTDVAGLPSDVVAISVGTTSQSALTASGAVVRFFASTPPAPAPFLGSDMATVSDGAEVCGITVSGEIQCMKISPFSPVAMGRGPVPGPIRDGGCVLGFGDDDGDGLCDTRDTCTNLAADGQIFASAPKPRAVLSGIGLDPVVGDDRLELNARFALPPGLAFGDLDPIAEGVRVEVASADGSLGEVTLGPGSYAGAGTAGWIEAAYGKSWRYIDATGTAPKVVKRGMITDRGAGAPGGRIDLRVVAARQTLSVLPADVPVLLTVVLGDAAAGLAGRCAQSTWPSCGFNAARSKLTCR